MPQIPIKEGDNLSALAAKYGTSVAALTQANKDNPSVKSSKLIIAGGMLNIPEAVGAPAGGPDTSAMGGLDVPVVQEQGAQSVGELGNLRIALREALNEAARKRIENSYKQIAPLAGGVPGTIGSVVDMIRAGVKTSAETTFSDLIQTFREASDIKTKELDRINELRAEFGSAVPSSVTDLKTALDLIAPLVDKERKLKLEKMVQEQMADEDVETAADFVARGGSLVQIGGSSNYKAKVRIRAEAIRIELEEQSKQERKKNIRYYLENKYSTYEQEIERARLDLCQPGQETTECLTPEEHEEIVNYIEELRLLEKEKKKEKDRMKGGALTTAATMGLEEHPSPQEFPLRLRP